MSINREKELQCVISDLYNQVEELEKQNEAIKNFINTKEKSTWFEGIKQIEKHLAMGYNKCLEDLKEILKEYE